MTVILNDAAITALFETPQGPVARFVEREAEKIAEDVQSSVAGYFHTAVTLNVHQDVGIDMQGSTAIVGIRDGAPDVAESKARRLVRAGLMEKWFRQALERA